MSPLAQQVAEKSLDEVLRFLQAELAARLSADVGEPVDLGLGEVQAPRWEMLGDQACWVGELTFSITIDGKTEDGSTYWPARLDPKDSAPCIDQTVAPGVHEGLFLGAPLAVGRGVRLRAGIHQMARHVRGRWRTEPVMAADLGREVFGKALRAKAERDPVLAQHLAELEEASDNLVAELNAEDGNGPRAIPPSRTAAERNRLFGPDEVMAELVLSALAESRPRRRRPAESEFGAKSAAAPSADAEQTLATLRRRVQRAFEVALARLPQAASVVARVDRGTTLARIEQSARTSFIGYRAMAGTLRGRPDLRDLDPGWRHILCPVQTPESTDVGLVRYTAVGIRPDAPDHLSDWFDVSASAALIPFINHDDPARASIGSKNLKQAVPVVGAEPPIVATGWERVLGLAHGTARAPFRGRVTAIERDAIEITALRGHQLVRIAYGAPMLPRSGIDNTWTLDVELEDLVTAGQILAHAPDVVSHSDDDAELVLGVNALVALTPWHGLNYEDAVVVSRSFARRMTSTHLVRIDEPLDSGNVAEGIWEPGHRVAEGEPVVLVRDGRGSDSVISAPVAGELVEIFSDTARGTIAIVIRATRELAIGDKISNRHQGKGVVSTILDDDEMPRMPNGRSVDVIINPLGVLRRLNIGQLWEMHVGLLSMLDGSGQAVVGRRIDDPEALRSALRDRGAERGRVQLTLPDGQPLGGPEGVVVGPQYLLKLDHLASAKLSVRGGEQTRSPFSQQPSQSAHFRRGERVGAAQRLGEMELWALHAVGADRVVEDALVDRAAIRSWEQDEPRASLRAVHAHLTVAGIELVTTSGATLVEEVLGRDAVRALRVLAAAPSAEELPGWQDADKWPRAFQGANDRGWRTGGSAALLGGDFDETWDRAIGHPLYSAELHGRPGSPERERVKYYIPLPTEVPHPWSGLTSSLGQEGALALPDVSVVPVLPPVYRVAGRSSLDGIYQELAIAARRYARYAGDIVRLEESGSAEATVSAVRDYQEDEGKKIARCVDRILGRPGSGGEVQPESVLGRLAGKTGLLRRFLLGQSTTHSGRGVIVPDPSLDPECVGLPRRMAERLGVTSSEADGDVVFINRQPTLHPYNIVALRALAVAGDAIRLHPIILGGLAGDFDGDTVAVHRPISEEARRQAWELLRPSANLRSAAAGAVLAKTDLDIALGLSLQAKDADGVRELAAWSGLSETEVREADPSVLADAVAQVGSDRTSTIASLAELERRGWAAATGWSVGALDLLLDGRGGKLAEAMAAGVAGGEGAVRQLLDARGAIIGGYGGTPVVDVRGCFLTGLASDDYFGTAPGAIASLAEKKLTSPVAGALTKTLVEIADTVRVGAEACELDDGEGSPLICRASDGVCAVCYGEVPGTGERPRAGRRVGLLAATLIGERSTQLSMKVFHGGGQAGTLGGGISELRAIFGDGRAGVLSENGEPRNLRQYLAEHLPDAEHSQDPTEVLTALRPLVDRVVELLGARVSRVHVEVVLRELLDTYRHELGGGVLDVNPLRDRLVARAQRRGRGPFEVATGRGTVRELLVGSPGSEIAGGPRTRLALGGRP